MFESPPRPADLERWPRLFAEEVGRPPTVRHQAFGWDSPEGDVGAAQAFAALGFHVLRSSVLTASAVTPPPHFSPAIAVRPLETEDEWRWATENQIACRDPEHDEAAYRVFKEAQMERYRAMARAGHGAWYGAFEGEGLVADLGLYRGGELARFQSVETHPQHRCRGYAGALVYHAARHALGQPGVARLVLVADAGSPAERLYRSVGFQPTERAAALERW
ncbi:MAG TPA: GNAT family N-acetyltransferase [Anaerolineales bacterium]|nr:GNAT family N-acetyltransferase [Anaerolineales bacterium]